MWKPIVHELDYNLIQMRNNDLNVHVKKLNEIKKMKNKYTFNKEVDNKYVSNVTNKNAKIVLSRNEGLQRQASHRHNRDYDVDRDNKTLSDRLYEISVRSQDKVN